MRRLNASLLIKFPVSARLTNKPALSP